MCIHADELETAKKRELFKSHHVYLREVYNLPLLKFVSEHFFGFVYFGNWSFNFVQKALLIGIIPAGFKRVKE